MLLVQYTTHDMLDTMCTYKIQSKKKPTSQHNKTDHRNPHIHTLENRLNKSQDSRQKVYEIAIHRSFTSVLCFVSHFSSVNISLSRYIHDLPIQLVFYGNRTLFFPLLKHLVPLFFFFLFLFFQLVPCSIKDFHIVFKEPLCSFFHSYFPFILHIMFYYVYLFGY